MNRSMLHGLRNEAGDVGLLAQAALEGQKDAISPLMDALQENRMESLYLVEQGKCYMVQTPTFYWLGRVKYVDWVKVVLEDVTQVFDTGTIEDCFGKGIITNGETFPKNITVTINTDMIGACPDWIHPLPPQVRS